MTRPGKKSATTVRAGGKLRPRVFELKKGTAHFSELQQARKLEKQQPDQATAIYQGILQREPDHPQANYLLGLLRVSRGQGNAALVPLGKAGLHFPDDPKLLFALGSIYRARGLPQEALARLQEAEAQAPTDARIQLQLGRALADLTRHREAETHYQRALQLDPALAEAHLHQGYLHRDRGEAAEAEASFRRALQLKPRYAEAWRGLTAVRRFQAGDADLQGIEALIADPGMPAAGRTALMFAHAKALEDTGDKESAFLQLLEANRSRRAAYEYSTEQSRDMFRAYVEAFSPERLRAIASAAIDDPAPLFIVGMPRSGTSLVEQILASHPEVFGAGELPHSRLFSDRTRLLSKLPFPGGLAFVSETDLREMGAAYLEQLHALSEQPRITDKLPHNFLMLPLLATLFPKATVIHCQREPMDTCVSIFRHYFATSHPYASDLKELGEYYRLYAALMDIWRERLPGRIIDVQYEALVADPEPGIHQLLERCGLTFDTACLTPHRTARSINTPSALQVREPLHQRGTGAWQAYTGHLAPLRQALEDPAPTGLGS